MAREVTWRSVYPAGLSFDGGPGRSATDVANDLEDLLAAERGAHAALEARLAELDRENTTLRQLMVGYEAFKDEAARLALVERVRYLPLECPNCGRMRLEYWPAEHKVKCEKCGADNDVLADIGNVARIEELESDLAKNSKPV